jgi:phosphatidylethanolamine-binding protein (PEBP) family uncharacterized protein
MSGVCTRAVTIILLLTSASALAQQADPLTQFEVKGHVYEPQAIAPTDQPIPVKYSDDGKGVSPPIEWGQLPAGTKSFLLGHVLAEGVLFGTFRKAP